MKLRKQFEGHSFGIGCIAWCPFSRYIIACGTDECNELWIWDIEVKKIQRKKQNKQSFRLTYHFSKKNNAHV